MKKQGFVVLMCLGTIFLPMRSPAEVMLQIFNRTWNDIHDMIPALAEIGYGSIYIPVPNKAGSQFSVGYDCYDRFDLGDQDRNGTIRTKYGTKHELLRMIQKAQRFGIRVYLDNVMNHNSFGVPGGDENTPIDWYPDVRPEDFHLVKDGYFWRKSGSIEGHHYESGDHRAVQQYTLSDLTDFSNEVGNWDIPGPDFTYVRQPDEPELYPDYSDPSNYIEDADGNRIYKFNESNPTAGDPVTEDINQYLIRAARWTLRETQCDGFRFDAVKHVVPEFFGTYYDNQGHWGDYLGYCGAIQAEFDIQNGFTDLDTRNSLFDEDAPRDDALLFGEAVPHAFLNLYDYVWRGMRLLDFDFEGTAASVFDGWGNEKYAGNVVQDLGRLGPAFGVMQPMNHDHNQYADMDMLQTYMLLRDGIPLIYTAGNIHELPDKNGRVFPEDGVGNFLGQYQNNNIIDRLPNLIWDQMPESEITRAIWIHEQFNRGYDANKIAEEDVVVNQKRYPNNYQGTIYSNNYEAALLLTAFNNDRYSQETHYRSPFVDFRPNQLLFNYATRHGGFDQNEWVRVNPDWSLDIKIPPGHYAAYSYMVPGRSTVAWTIDPIVIEQPAGTPVSWIPTYRVDGRDGDPDWDDDGILNEEDPIFVPRVTGDEHLRFIGISDGLSAIAMIRINEGIDVNGNGLDNPKGFATDVYWGYEPMSTHFKRKGGTYFYDRNTGTGDPYFAITSDMDDINGDGNNNEDDFWARHEYEFEYDVGGIDPSQFEEGYQIARVRFFRRRGDLGTYWYGCDLYNTFKQSFYVDRFAPTGTIVYPGNGDGLWSQEYGMVIRTDDSVIEALVHIDDDDPTNDDAVTGVNNGNGIATNGVGLAYAPATQVVPAINDPNITQHDETFPQEWRFAYRNIPSSGNAIISVQLHEASSQVDASRITTLVTTNTCHAPEAKLEIVWPMNGSVIDFTDYTIVVNFTDCQDGGSVCLEKDPNRFSFFVDGSFLPRDSYTITDWNPGDGFAELRVAWSNFNAGTHLLEVRYDDPLYNLQASSEVTTTYEITQLKFNQPPPFDFNGLPYIITLPYPNPSTNYTVLLESSLDVLSLWIDIDAGSWSGNAQPIRTNNNIITWQFIWSGLTTNDEGSHGITAYADTDGYTAIAELEAQLTTQITFQQLVPCDGTDSDHDDDGIPDSLENEAYDIFTDKPTASDWTNGDVHQYHFSGKTDACNVDSDGDLLPDALELGIGGAFDPGTDITQDTDMDGFPNFLGDIDPPIYNTWYQQIPGKESLYLPSQDQFILIDGSVTDPNNKDTDGDGIEDGIEDENRNGAVDPLETDPNDTDTDGDDRRDGNEDANRNGFIDGDTNQNRMYDVNEAWSETDPLSVDTDGDSLPDGWESRYGLDPLDNGMDSLRSTTPDDGNVDAGFSGNPDGDAFNNYQEYLNNTDPTFDDTQVEVNARTITIGAGPSSGTLQNREYFEQFMDWLPEDVHVMDEFNGTGSGRNGYDTYFGFTDGFDPSRDIVAFYSRNGGDNNDRYYFRVDFQDLQYLAEEGSMDLYVVIDTGSPTIGEKALPHEIDCTTELAWEVMVAVYQSGFGEVFVDENSFNNTSGINEDLFETGVVSRPDYFKQVYFRSDYDAVEFSIDRQALLDVGWNGFSPLNFQVYTTRDGTQNDNGEGDLFGYGNDGSIFQLSDITDAIMDDGRGIDDGELNGWIWGGWEANRVKFAMLHHETRGPAPSSDVQQMLPFYHHTLDIHKFFNQKANLYLSPTFASSIEWANNDFFPEKDGPSFNQRISQLIFSNQVYVLPGPYSELFLPHFGEQASGLAIDSGMELLNAIYNTDFPNWWDVLWIPEGVISGTNLTFLANRGNYFTILDQWTHIFDWFGRDAATRPDGHSINEVNGVKIFPANVYANEGRFVRHDGGLGLELRNLLYNKARQDWARNQIIVMRGSWDQFTNPANSLAFEKNMDWIANHPWIQVVCLDEISKGEIDITGDDDGDHWPTVNHGNGVALDRLANTFVHYASQSDYDHWYFGSAQEESLYDWYPGVDPGEITTKPFGHIGTPGTLAHDTWSTIDGFLGGLSFEKLSWYRYFLGGHLTGFHHEDSFNPERWSTGDYIYPDETYDALATFSKTYQSDLRQAGLYGAVATWAFNPPASVVRQQVDYDQDGEQEFVLYNDRVFAAFEDNGGRMIAAFARDLGNNEILQMIGNTLASPESANELEGMANTDGTNVVAQRTSGLKDWWASGPDKPYVNELYTGSLLPDGIQWVSLDGAITKTIRLATVSSTRFDIEYQLSPSINTLYIRHGLSPHLFDLVQHGQQHLGDLVNANGVLELVNDNFTHTARIRVHYADAGHTAQYVSTANDHDGLFDTRNMRNQTYVEQVELSGSGTFSMALALEASLTDTDMDGTANIYDIDDDNDGYSDEQELMVDPATGLPQSDPYDASSTPPDNDLDGLTDAEDPDDDNDGMVDTQEVAAGTDPLDASSVLLITSIERLNSGSTCSVTWKTVGGKKYTVEFAPSNELINGTFNWHPIPEEVFHVFETDVPEGEGNEHYETFIDDGSYTLPFGPNETHRYYRIRVHE